MTVDLKVCLTCEDEFTHRPIAYAYCSSRCRGRANWRRKNDKPVPDRLNNPRRRWGEGSINEGGYLQTTRNGVRKYEHQWVMEDHLGRLLLPDEEVHHRNGDKLDNRYENLELWTTKQPKGQRVKDIVEYATEFLDARGYTVVPPLDENPERLK